MNPLKNFEEFVKEGIVKIQQPDFNRAKFLAKESEEQLSFIKEIVLKMGVDNKNSNSIIKLSYDIIMEMIRAEMLIRGYNASGSYAHEAEVSYLGKLNFSELDVQFLNNLRYSRNGITYYGKMFEEDYAKKVLDFLERIYSKLKNLMDHS